MNNSIKQRATTDETQRKFAVDRLRILCRNLKDVGEDELADKVLCALSVVAKSKKPKTQWSYSSIMRELREKQKDDIPIFQKVFKKTFEDALDNNLENPDRTALMAAMMAIDFDE